MRRIVRMRGPKAGGAGKDDGNDDNASGGGTKGNLLRVRGYDKRVMEGSRNPDNMTQSMTRGEGEGEGGHREVRMMRQCRVVHID